MSPVNSAGYVSVPELAEAALLDPGVLLAATRCNKPTCSLLGSGIQA